MQVVPHDLTDESPAATAAVAGAPPAAAVRPMSTTEARLVAGILFVCSASVIAVACYLQADAHGLGTHTQLGLPPCAFYQRTGLPCPTCGYTTSFTLAAHGHLIEAFLNQPAGGVLALLTAMTALVSGYALVFGLSLAPLGQVLFRPSTFWIFGALILLAWLYKILLTLGMIP